MPAFGILAGLCVVESSWGTFIDCPDFPFHFLCREIRIKVDAPTILEGKALKLLSTEPYNGCAFRWAHKLIFDIVTDRSYDEDDGRLPPDAYDNVLTFARRIKEMAPRVSEVSLDIGDADGNLTTIIGKHTCFLLLNLSTIARKTLFANGCKQLVACPDLALTINIWSYYEADISGLIRDDDDGNYAVYPLILRSHYPFGDDVVFRGNDATLEYLKVALYPELVTILERHNVFTRTSHPQLKALPPALLLLKDYVSIQVLALPRVRLSFWGAVYLIKSLPLLSDLHTRAPIRGEIPQGVADADLPEYVRSAYAPMGRRSRCWHIAYHSIYDNVDLVTSILLLALICPNFDYAAVYKDYRESFMKEMRK
ncbi:hypothetical protein GGH94_005940 [Coemansia aciculifera]|uniref:Uncharacterized protein n=1 Tax=Coemansia aciculifera TaxID=417176 RepID=A0A9W8M271_9FUNG|nr:hypothetical protein GGH94_005940 [Coemansia aciculifera]